MLTRSRTIVTVRGIPIRIDASLVVIAALLGWSFWAGFVSGYGVDGLAAGLMAAVAVVGFLGSILLHELAHSLEAQHRGVRVRSITLFVFGGVTESDFDVRGPRDELALVAAGPLTSFLLAGSAVGRVVDRRRGGGGVGRPRRRHARVAQPRPRGVQPAPGRAPRRRPHPAGDRLGGHRGPPPRHAGRHPRRPGRGGGPRRAGGGGGHVPPRRLHRRAVDGGDRLVPAAGGGGRGGPGPRRAAARRAAGRVAARGPAGRAVADGHGGRGGGHVPVRLPRRRGPGGGRRPAGGAGRGGASAVRARRAAQLGARRPAGGPPGRPPHRRGLRHRRAPAGDRRAPAPWSSCTRAVRSAWSPPRGCGRCSSASRRSPRTDAPAQPAGRPPPARRTRFVGVGGAS